MLAWIFFIYTRLTYGMAAFENRNLFLETGHRSNTPDSLFFRVATNRSLKVLFFIITYASVYRKLRLRLIVG